MSRNNSVENDLPGPPTLCGVLETVLYFSDQDRCERFYRDLLGMRLMDREPGRSLFFRAGDSVFLMFDADATLSEGKLPAHGARGPVHTCFRVPPDEYDSWKNALLDQLGTNRMTVFASFFTKSRQHSAAGNSQHTETSFVIGQKTGVFKGKRTHTGTIVGVSDRVVIG